MEETGEARTPGLEDLLQYWLSLAGHSPAGCTVCVEEVNSLCVLRAVKRPSKLLNKLGIYITIQLEKL